MRSSCPRCRQGDSRLSRDLRLNGIKKWFGKVWMNELIEVSERQANQSESFRSLESARWSARMHVRRPNAIIRCVAAAIFFVVARNEWARRSEKNRNIGRLGAFVDCVLRVLPSTLTDVGCNPIRRVAVGGHRTDSGRSSSPPFRTPPAARAQTKNYFPKKKL